MPCLKNLLLGLCAGLRQGLAQYGACLCCSAEVRNER